MLIDDVTITIKAGNGGNGSAHFKRNAQTARGGPDGGNGGNGGDIYFQGVNDILLLSQFQYKKSLSSNEGIKGGRQNMYGKNGEDLIVKVPFGTRITDLANNKQYEINDETKVFLAKGGKGGRGNNEFKTATNQAPKFAEPGGIGEEKKLRLELLLIADIGLIGLPNAGKSSLLQTLTNAHPKIGNYPFTTLEPNLGVMYDSKNKKQIVIADIPGLIEGSSTGKGLGIKFLKHIEKTKILLHCIDLSSEKILDSYQTIREEMFNYSSFLKQKKEILLLTKTDLIDKNTLKEKIKLFKNKVNDILTVSIYDEESINILIDKLSSIYTNSI